MQQRTSAMHSAALNMCKHSKISRPSTTFNRIVIEMNKRVQQQLRGKCNEQKRVLSYMVRVFLHWYLLGCGGVYIYSFICLSAGMTALLLCYSIALCTSEGGISSSLECVFLVPFCIGRPSKAFLAAWVTFSIAFVSLCSLWCNNLSANESEVVDYGHKHIVLCLLIFLQVSSEHPCCGQG